MGKLAEGSHENSLPIHLDPRAPLAVSVQIAEQIKLLIATKKLQVGEPLPSTIALAKQLQANHNTIASVYSSLVDSGYLIAKRGKGTFVADTLCVRNLIKNNWYYILLRQAFAAAQNIQLPPTEFAGAAYAQAVMISNSQPSPPKLVFVEEESLHGLEICKLVESEIGLPVSFVGYNSAATQQSEIENKLLSADLVITTTDYVEQATQISELCKEILVLKIRPSFELLTQVSSLSRGAQMLIIGLDYPEAKRFEQLLEESGISHIRLYTVGLEHIQQYINKLEKFDAICLSSQAQSKTQETAVSFHPNLGVFDFKLDPTNLLVLKSRINSI